MLCCRFLLLACLLLTHALVAGAGQDQPPAKDLYGDPLPAGAVARLGTVRFRHASPILFADFLPGGKSVLSVGRDGIVCVWEFPSGKEVRRFEAQPASERPADSAAQVTSASLSPDRKHLTALCGDGFMRIWDWADAKQLGKVSISRGDYGGGFGGGGFGFNPLGGGLGALGGFGDPYDGRDDYFGVFKVYSADAKTLMLYGSRVLQLVDLSSGKEVGPRLGHTASLTSIWVTPDGKQALTTDTSSLRRTWDPVTGKELGTITTAVKPPPSLAYPTPIVLSPDGRVGVAVATFWNLAAAQEAKVREAVLFDTTTGKEFGKIALELEMASWPTHHRPLLFSPDDKLLAAVATEDGKEKIELHEVPSGKRLRTLDAGPAAPPGQRGGLGALGGGLGVGGGGFGGPQGSYAQRMLFSPDAKALAFQAGPSATIVVLNTMTGKQIAGLPAFEGSPALQGVFSPDRRCLALERGDGTVTLFELASGQPRCSYGSKPPALPVPKDDPRAGLGFEPMAMVKTRASLAISPDGKLLALSGLGGSIHVCDVWTGKELTVFKGHTLAVNALVFAPDGKTLASASYDTTALIWDVSKVARPALPAKAPQPGDLEAWWQALADSDAAKAFAAMRALAAVPKEAVAWINDRVKPAPPLDGQRALDLMKRLDEDQFEARDQAKRELLKLGELLLPILDQALAGNPSPESERRLKELHGKLTDMALQGDRLRVVRVVEILELIGTPQARQVLQALADGAPGALTTTSAQAALKR